MSRILSPEYIAGIIDGEGWIGFNVPRAKSMKIAIQVSMTHEGVVTLLHEQLRGSIIAVNREGNRKRQYRWSVYSNDAANVLIMVKPHLIVKYDQAALALGFWAFEERNDELINELLKTKMHALNQRGK